MGLFSFLCPVYNIMTSSWDPDQLIARLWSVFDQNFKPEFDMVSHRSRCPDHVNDIQLDPGA